MQQRSKHLKLQISALLPEVPKVGSWLLAAIGSLCLLVQGSDCLQLRASTQERTQRSETGNFPESERAEPGVALVRNLLAAHNTIRARLKLPLLAWSDKQAQSAQAWADTLIATGEFSIHGPGQNLAESRPAGSLRAGDVVNLWASEAKYYNPATNVCSARCGHYTQLVWRDTRTVGCGVAQDRTRTVWVCDYAPPGNIVGERPY
jgi:pathogenesis-related protein 1